MRNFVKAQYHGAAVLCLLVLSAPIAVSQNKAPRISKESITSNKKNRHYYLFVPSNIKSPAPLIVLLHGSGRDGMSLVEPWKDLATQEGFIVVGPDAENPTGWSGPEDGPDFLHDVIENLKSKYEIDARRVYLFGHSAGAVFALMMSMVESEYFAATAVHAGAFRAPDEFKSINNASRKIPLAIWVGTNDPFFQLADVHATRDALRAKGFIIEVTEMRGHDHWYYDLAPKINQSAWEFLKQYELKSEPRYSEYAAPRTADSANKLIEEINALGVRAEELTRRGNDNDTQLNNQDLIKDRTRMTAAVKEQVDILTEAGSAWRSAAEKAETLSHLALPARQKQYFSLAAHYNLKCAELIDAMREGAEALLGGESADVIAAKRELARKRAEKLHGQLDEIRKTIDSLK